MTKVEILKITLDILEAELDTANDWSECGCAYVPWINDYWRLKKEYLIATNRRHEIGFFRLGGIPIDGCNSLEHNFPDNAEAVFNRHFV